MRQFLSIIPLKYPRPVGRETDPVREDLIQSKAHHLIHAAKGRCRWLKGLFQVSTMITYKYTFSSSRKQGQWEFLSLLKT